MFSVWPDSPWLAWRFVAEPATLNPLAALLWIPRRQGPSWRGAPRQSFLEALKSRGGHSCWIRSDTASGESGRLSTSITGPSGRAKFDGVARGVGVGDGTVRQHVPVKPWLEVPVFRGRDHPRPVYFVAGTQRDWITAGHRLTKVNQDCTICVSCRYAGPYWTVPRKREKRPQSAGVPFGGLKTAPPLSSTQANFPARAFEITGTIPNPPTTAIVVLNLAVVA